jgi:hypothetical protein
MTPTHVMSRPMVGHLALLTTIWHGVRQGSRSGGSSAALKPPAHDRIANIWQEAK